MTSYRVVWLLQAQNTLKQLMRKASSPSIKQRLVRAVMILDDRLRRDPLEVGEIYRRRGAVDEHSAIQDVLGVDLAIDAERKLVLVRMCSAMAGYG